MPDATTVYVDNEPVAKADIRTLWSDLNAELLAKAQIGYRFSGVDTDLAATDGLLELAAGTLTTVTIRLQSAVPVPDDTSFAVLCGNPSGTAIVGEGGVNLRPSGVTLGSDEVAVVKHITGDNWSVRILYGPEAKTGTASGTLTMEGHSRGYFRTTGNVIIPATAGFNVTLKAGGAHTVQLSGGGTSPAMATGDVMSILIDDQGAIDAVLTPAADKVSFV